MLGALLALGVSRLIAQGITYSVTGVQSLSFGTLLPGIPAIVAPTSATSGVFTLSGKNNETVSLTFTLPSAMTGPGGATLPLIFGASSAGFSPTQSVANETLFDPTQNYQATLGHKVGSVYLGGTANPSVTQRAGSYTATITLSVVFM